MDTSGNRSARRTQTNASGRPDRNNGLITFVVRTLHNKPTRHQTGAVECLLHGADSPPNQSAKHPETASKVSQSPKLTLYGSGCCAACFGLKQVVRDDGQGGDRADTARALHG